MAGMRARTAQLACLLLLLSTFGAAEASDRAASRLSSGSCAIGALLHQSHARLVGEPCASVVTHAQAGLPIAFMAGNRAIWTMRPPAAQTLAQHAVTGSGL